MLLEVLVVCIFATRCRVARVKSALGNLVGGFKYFLCLPLPVEMIQSDYCNIFHPKDPWTLQWRGWNLYSRGLGSQNRHF